MKSRDASKLRKNISSTPLKLFKRCVLFSLCPRTLKHVTGVRETSTQKQKQISKEKQKEREKRQTDEDQMMQKIKKMLNQLDEDGIVYAFI